MAAIKTESLKLKEIVLLSSLWHRHMWMHWSNRTKMCWDGVFTRNNSSFSQKASNSEWWLCCNACCHIMICNYHRIWAKSMITCSLLFIIHLTQELAEGITLLVYLAYLQLCHLNLWQSRHLKHAFQCWAMDNVMAQTTGKGSLRVGPPF